MALDVVKCRIRWLLVALAVAAPLPSYAAPALPGPADAGRIDQRDELKSAPSNLLPPSAPMDVLPPTNPPAQSRHLVMTLHAVHITGMTAFTTAQVQEIYAPYINHEITMDTVWLIAGELTEKYRNAGYFLSKVTVPEQKIKDGVVILNVAEGYIGDIKFDDPLAQNRIIAAWLDKLRTYRPLKAEQLESVLLQINDLAGVNLHAVLQPLNDKTEPGAVRLFLENNPTEAVSGRVSFDNNGSKFLGPYQITAQAQAMLLPQQKTSVTVLSALPMSELKYGGIKQEIPVMMGGEVEVYANRTAAQPGYTLKREDIESDSTLLGVALDYKIIRQRQENLTARVAFESRNTDSDILDTPLTRDYIRALRANLAYETADGWNGYDQFSGTLSQGLDIFGASPAGQLNLSRAEATPDFTKFEASFNRLQPLNQRFTLVTAAAMQVASGPLYSSEEFGYGGQAFGRAYDDSEITGDHGVAATAELRYMDLDAQYGVKPVPYGFYDVGIVWNDDRDQAARASGSSGGAGVKLLSDLGITADFDVAFPLTKPIDNPLEGNGKNPRYSMQVSYGF
jgi:hemolysin activation/secretion protein